MWKMTCIHFTDRIKRYSLYKWHGKENNLARVSYLSLAKEPIWLLATDPI